MQPPKDYFAPFPEPWYNRLANAITFWFWLRQMDLRNFIHTGVEFQAGMRKVEAHILDDLEFGYTAAMIAGKIANHSYSYPEFTPQERNVFVQEPLTGAAIWDMLSAQVKKARIQLIVLDRLSQERLLEFISVSRAQAPLGYMGEAHSFVSTEVETTGTQRWVETPLGEFELLIDQHAAPGGRVDFYA